MARHLTVPNHPVLCSKSSKQQTSRAIAPRTGRFFTTTPQFARTGFNQRVPVYDALLMNPDIALRRPARIKQLVMPALLLPFPYQWQLEQASSPGRIVKIHPFRYSPTLQGKQRLFLTLLLLKLLLLAAQVICF